MYTINLLFFYFEAEFRLYQVTFQLLGSDGTPWTSDLSASTSWNDILVLELELKE